METCRAGRNDRPPPSGGPRSNRLEWNEDALDAQNLGNAAIDGDDPTSQTLAPTTRRGNYTQISTKVVQISGRSQAVVAAGGSNKMGYQLLKKSKELKRQWRLH